MLRKILIIIAETKHLESAMSSLWEPNILEKQGFSATFERKIELDTAGEFLVAFVGSRSANIAVPRLQVSFSESCQSCVPCTIFEDEFVFNEDGDDGDGDEEPSSNLTLIQDGSCSCCYCLCR